MGGQEAAWGRGMRLRRIPRPHAARVDGGGQPDLPQAAPSEEVASEDRQSATMASFGHESTQVPQSVQSSGSIV